MCLSAPHAHCRPPPDLFLCHRLLHPRLRPLDQTGALRRRRRPGARAMRRRQSGRQRRLRSRLHRDADPEQRRPDGDSVPACDRPGAAERRLPGRRRHQSPAHHRRQRAGAGQGAARRPAFARRHRRHPVRRLRLHGEPGSGRRDHHRLPHRRRLARSHQPARPHHLRSSGPRRRQRRALRATQRLAPRAARSHQDPGERQRERRQHPLERAALPPGRRHLDGRLGIGRRLAAQPRRRQRSRRAGQQAAGRQRHLPARLDQPARQRLRLHRLPIADRAVERPRLSGPRLRGHRRRWRATSSSACRVPWAASTSPRRARRSSTRSASCPPTTRRWRRRARR